MPFVCLRRNCIKSNLKRLTSLGILNNTDNDPSSLSILIVDDNFDIVRLMERGLKEHGFNVSAFTDLAIALEDSKRNCKDCGLILSDIRTLEMNGYELIRKAKEMDKQVKVILMSAFEINGDGELNNVFTDVEIDGFLQKPFSMVKLNDIIEKISMSTECVFV
jgi:response regulator RpfG family c-di-GMP phosphodiesterase